MFMKWTRSDPQPRREIAPESLLEMPVVPEWDQMVQRADEMACLVDQHLEYESALQGRDMTVETLCPEQKTSLVSDLAYLTRS